VHVPILFSLTDSSKAGGAPAVAGRHIDFLPLLALGFTVAVATCTYLLIERPFLRMRGRWAPVGQAPAETPATPAPAPATA
jgi:peptidoglycan/LPS O-acetylase OafA/YrhL